MLKADDDVYLNPSRLLAASGQWDRMGAEYVGCMKHGFPFRQPTHKWYEPANLLIGYTYWLHAYGSIYAISGRVARYGSWVLGLEPCTEQGLLSPKGLCQF